MSPEEWDEKWRTTIAHLARRIDSPTVAVEQEEVLDANGTLHHLLFWSLSRHPA